MKKTLLFGILASTSLLIVGCTAFGSKIKYVDSKARLKKIKKVVYTNPEVYPDVEELKDPTYNSFYNATTDYMLMHGNPKILRIDTPMSFDTIDTTMVRNLSKNNDAQVVIVPKVKYFKVGIGKYVFSNQVLVSLKLFDEEGNLIIESSYDTYKGNARLLGSAENSVKIGTVGVIKKIIRELRNKKISYDAS